MSDILDRLAELKIPTASYEAVERLPSGSLALDWALGGGWPKGRFSLLFGHSDQGKSTLMLLAAAANSQAGRNVGYWDAENAFSWDWAEKMGVEREHFYLFQSQPEDSYLEHVLDQIHMLLANDVFDLLILDSIDALPARKVLEGDLSDNPLGIAPIKWSQFFRKAMPVLRRSHTAFVAVNQVREKIGVLYGSPEYCPGGKAQEFYASIRVRMTRAREPVIAGDAGQLNGMVHAGKVVKNKTCPPFREFQVIVRQRPFYGPDLIPELFSLGKQLGVLRNREGEAYRQGVAVFNATELGVGEKQVIAFLRQNPDVSRALEESIRSAMEGL